VHEYWHNLAMTIVGISSILSACIVVAGIVLLASATEIEPLAYKRVLKWGGVAFTVGILLCIFIWPLASVMNVF
jgi:hypothetical protein